MSGVDPLAAVAAELAAMQGAGSDAALDLGAIAQILQTQLSVGDLLAATVLPAKGGQDLIEILGQVVVAQLPPDVHPGETLLLQVTGFQGNQILVHNLGTQDPSNPVPTFVLEVPPEIAGSGATTATLTTAIGNPAAPAPPATPSGALPPPANAVPQSPNPAAAPLPQPQAEAPIAPSRAVFVAASVVPSPPATATPNAAVQAAPASLPQPAAQGTAQAPAPAAPTEERPETAPLAQPPSGQRPATQAAPPTGVSSQPTYVEARLAAARATPADRSLPANLNAAPQTKSAPPPPTAAQRAASPPPPPAALHQNTAALRESVFAKRINMPVMPGLVSRATSPATQAQAAVQTRAAAPSPAMQIASAVASKEPVRILAALRVPATPVTLAAARLVGNATAQVTTALQNLDRVLAQTQSADARLSTLQTITSFIAKLDPRSEPAFAAQISSFVGNVVDGAETKLSQLLQALLPRAVHQTAAAVAAPESPAAPADMAQAAAPSGPGAPVLAQPGSALAPAHAPILAQARAAERQVAITHDLKSTLLSLLANPPAGQTPQLAQAMHDSLSALTAMQFNSLIAAQTDPQTIAFSLPVMFYEGGQAANIRISREAPKNKQRLDGDNFHIAFVLDTASLGTVAIDLETTGRTVKVNVKTDRASAVDRFTSSLGDLSARLEHLRYNVASTAAAMIGAPAAQPAAVPQHTMKLTKTSNVDLQA